MDGCHRCRSSLPERQEVEQGQCIVYQIDVLNNHNQKIWAACLLAAAPYYANDLSNIYINSFPLWVSIDYVCRVFSLGVIAFIVKRGVVTTHDLGFRSVRGDRLFFWTLIAGTTTIYMALHFSSIPWHENNPWPEWSIPPYDYGSSLGLWDYWVGLLFVAVSEEVLFRGMALHVCKKLGLHPALIFLIPSIIFASIHWSHSPGNIWAAFLFGLLFMVPTYRTGSIIPAILCHYIANLVQLRHLI